MASIIAGIDGYRRYEQNRAIDLNNQAQNMKNQEAGQILDLKTQLAALQNNPYAKYNIWDPVGRRQQLLSEDDQLKIASKWASSIKNLAPEKREQGYRQFLRAMPSLGIDVSDMPQGYDEGYIDMVAGLGVDTLTRYQNEQQNSRLERQIEANREARQDEFNKRLAAFDYENNYKTKAEKDKQLQIDNMIDASSLSPNDKERAKLAYRNITLPNVKTPQERLMDVFTNPDSTDEQRETARQELRRIAEFQKEIKSLEPVSLKDFAQSVKYLKESGADTETLNRLAEENDIIGNFENFDDFDKKLNAYHKSKAVFPDMPEAYHRKQAGLLSAEDEALGVGLNAGAEAKAQQPFLLERDNNASRNRVTESTISNAQQNDYKLQQMQLQSELDKDKATHQNFLNMSLEQYKSMLPTEQMRKIREESQATGIPVSEIVKQNKHLAETQQRLDIMQKQAQIRQTMVNVAKTQAEIPYAGMTDAAKNYAFVQQNPEAANSPLFRTAIKQERNKYQDAYDAEEGKARAKEEKARKDVEKMKPTVLAAINRAKDAASSGTGVGPIGGRLAGIGLNIGGKKAGKNYADIQSANTQMNTYLRKELAATGLTGTELNSAVEAQAYRYTIDPSDTESVILRKLDNFIADHINNTNNDEGSNKNLPIGQSVSIKGFTVERID